MFKMVYVDVLPTDFVILTSKSCLPETEAILKLFVYFSVPFVQLHK